MKEITTEQIRRVHCMYYGCDAVLLEKADLLNKAERHQPSLVNYIQHGSSIRLESRIKMVDLNVAMYGVEYIKLLLKPLSEISLEDAIEVARLCHGIPYKSETEYKIRLKEGTSIASPERFAQLYYTIYDEIERRVKDVIVANFCDTEREVVSVCRGNKYFSTMSQSFQFLISRGYSVPLLCLDGQDPITAGLAIAHNNNP